MKIGEFFLSVLVDASQGELTIGNLVTKMGDLEATSIGALAVVSKLGTELAKLTEISVNNAFGLAAITDTTNESSEALQKWGIAASLIGEHAETVRGSMQQMGQELGRIHNNMAPNSPLLHLAQKFGINLRDMQSAGQIYDNLYNNPIFQKMTGENKSLWLQQAGVASPNVISRMLSQSVLKPSDLKEALKDIDGISSKKTLGMFTQIGRKFAIIQGQVRAIGSDISTWFGPDVLKGASKMVEILKGGHDWLKEEMKPTPEHKTFWNVLKTEGIVYFAASNPYLALGAAGAYAGFDYYKFHEKGGSLFGSVLGPMASLIRDDFYAKTNKAVSDEAEYNLFATQHITIPPNNSDSTKKYTQRVNTKVHHQVGNSPK